MFSWAACLGILRDHTLSQLRGDAILEIDFIMFVNLLISLIWFLSSDLKFPFYYNQIELLNDLTTAFLMFCFFPLCLQDALEPYMSQRTLEVHWGEHHRGYLEGLNKQLAKSDKLYGYTLDELVKATYNNGNPLPEFNNAAQVRQLLFFSLACC